MDTDQNQSPERSKSIALTRAEMIFAVQNLKDMSLTLNKSLAGDYKETSTRTSAWKKFIGWADKQEEHRFGWTAFAIAGHGCVFTIITVMAILLAGNSFILWPFAIAAMAGCLLVNLAAMPTRITIPVLFLSILVDVAIIGICIAQGLRFSAIFPY